MSPRYSILHPSADRSVPSTPTVPHEAGQQDCCAAPGQDATSARKRIAQSAYEPLPPAPRSLAGPSSGKETAVFLLGYGGGFSGSSPATPHQHQVPR